MLTSSALINLPNNPSAEQGLLGALMIDNSALDRVSEFLKAEHFFAPVHADIYRAIQTLSASGRRFDPVTLKKYFDAEKDLAHLKGGEYLADLVAEVPGIGLVPDYGRDIADLFYRRQVIALCDDGIRSAKNPEPDYSPSRIIADLEVGLYGIVEDGPEERPTSAFSASIAEAIANAQAAYHGDPRAKGITSGLIDFDSKIGGLKKSDLIVIAGRPSQGKTALATGMAWRAAEAGAPAAFFSLEMSAAQIATRILAAQSGVPGDLIHKGAVHAEQFRKFVTASQALATLPLFINDRPGRTIAQIRSEVRRLKRRHGIGVIVVDYLQLIAAADNRSRNNSRVNDVTEITAGLKGLAKEFDVPVIALSQLSRAVEQRDDKRPQLSDLRESGSIEQDADIVAFVYREEYYLEREEPSRRANESEGTFIERYTDWERRKDQAKNKAELIIGKNRHGPICTVNLHFDGPTTTFSNLEATYSVAGK